MHCFGAANIEPGTESENTLMAGTPTSLVQTEGGLAQDHACDHMAFIGAHAADHAAYVFLQLPVAQAAQIRVHRKAAPAFENEGYFVGA